MRNLPRRGAHGLLLIAVLSGACGNEAPPAPPAVELEPIAWERNYVDSFQPRH